MIKTDFNQLSLDGNSIISALNMLKQYGCSQYSSYSDNNTCKYYNMKPIASGLSGKYASELRKKFLQTEDNYKFLSNKDRAYAYGIDHGHFVDAHCNLSINIRKTEKDNFSTKNRKINI